MIIHSQAMFRQTFTLFHLKGRLSLLKPLCAPTSGRRFRSNHSKKEMEMLEKNAVRVAVEGCGHGTLDAIYASVAKASQARGWDGVDLLIIGGDFQAVRNAADLTVMSVPAKYRELGDFVSYYNGEKKAPYLTIFIGGNHEAISHLRELHYGGWVAPNMYYLGFANVLRFGPLRIAGMSGIWKGFDYRKTHYERLPFSRDDISSFYHVREIDVRKLLLLREQVDVGLSHDWPRAIETHGNSNALWKMKPDFKKESRDGKLGNPAAGYVLDRLRPAYWFSAHLHCKYTAIKTFKRLEAESTLAEISPGDTPALTSEPEQPIGNPDEIELDDEDVGMVAGDANNPEKAIGNPDEIDLDEEGDGVPTEGTRNPEQVTGNPDEIDLNEEDDGVPIQGTHNTEPEQPIVEPNTSGVTDELRAQLPASFAAPPPATQGAQLQPGQPVPASIKNTTTRFLALDKCLPGRKFIQLCSLLPVDTKQLRRHRPEKNAKHRYSLQYDPEWLAITRVFARDLTINDPEAAPPPDLGEEEYTRLIDVERAWVHENVVSPGKLAVPDNFQITAPPYKKGMPEIVAEQPVEYTNPQTTAFCELIGVPDLWDASPEERVARNMISVPLRSIQQHYGGGHQGRGGRGGRGGGGRGGRGGRGRGGRGRGRGGRH